MPLSLCAFFETCIFSSFAHFFTELFGISLLYFLFVFLHTLDINSRSDEWVANIFLSFCDLSLYSSECFLCCVETFCLNMISFSKFWLLLALLSGSYPKIIFYANVLKCLPYISFYCFHSSYLTFSSLIHFELIFV